MEAAEQSTTAKSPQKGVARCKEQADIKP